VLRQQRAERSGVIEIVGHRARDAGGRKRGQLVRVKVAKIVTPVQNRWQRAIAGDQHQAHPGRPEVNRTCWGDLSGGLDGGDRGGLVLMEGHAHSKFASSWKAR
jgi:hypothetical protein